MKVQKRPDDQVPPAPPYVGTSPGNAGGPRSAMAIPIPHDTHCIYAQLLMQLRWQLADARRENTELTACLRRLLQQIQVLNAVLDACDPRSAGRSPRVMTGREAGEASAGVVVRATRSGIPVAPDPRTLRSPLDSPRTQRNQ